MTSVVFQQSYFQLRVDLNTRSPWFRALESDIRMISYRWQAKQFHITVAFLDDQLDLVGAKKVAALLDEELRGFSALVITFDKLDAFTASGGEHHIVNLTASTVPSEFTAFVNRIRARLRDAGYKVQDYGSQEFKLHVTIAYIKTSRIGLQQLQDRIGKVDVPPTTLALTKADYRFYGGGAPIREWELPAISG